MLINGDEFEFGAIDTRFFRCGGVLRKQIKFQLGFFVNDQSVKEGFFTLIVDVVHQEEVVQFFQLTILKLVKLLVHQHLDFLKYPM